MSETQALVERQEAGIQQRNPLQAIVEIATSGQQVDMEVFRGLMDIRRELEAEQARIAFNAAMSRAQARMPLIPKDKANSHTRSKYSSYEAVDRLIRPIYTAEGISLGFKTEQSPIEGYTRHICEVRHEAGHVETHYMDLPADEAGAKGNSNKNAVQALGSSATYGKRYLVFMVFALAQADDPTDDDGNTAAKRGPDLVAFNEQVRKHWPFINALKEAIAAEDWPEVALVLNQQAKQDADAGLETEDTLRRLWVAPSKGGVFETYEKKAIRCAEVTELRR